MSLYLTNSGANLVIANGGVPVASGPKAALTSSDFTYLGAFKLDNPTWGWWLGRHLTFRRNGSTDELYTCFWDEISGDTENIHLAKCTVPASFTGQTVTTTLVNGSPMYPVAGKFTTGAGAGWTEGFYSSNSDPNTAAYGLFWDHTDSRFYWMTTTYYYDETWPQTTWGYSTINDGTNTVTPVKTLWLPNTFHVGTEVGDGCRSMAVMSETPTWFRSYVGGKRLSLGGWGGVVSRNMNGHFCGPTMFAVQPMGAEADRSEWQGGVTRITHFPRNKNFSTGIKRWYANHRFGPSTYDNGWDGSHYDGESQTQSVGPIWVDTPAVSGTIASVWTPEGYFTSTIASYSDANPYTITVSGFSGDVPRVNDVIFFYTQPDYPSYSSMYVTGVSGSGTDYTFTGNHPIGHSTPFTPRNPVVGQTCIGGFAYVPGGEHIQRGKWYFVLTSNHSQLIASAANQTPDDYTDCCNAITYENWEYTFPDSPFTTWKSGSVAGTSPWVMEGSDIGLDIGRRAICYDPYNYRLFVVGPGSSRAIHVFQVRSE